ncbi:MAG: hypothetical protein KKB50_14935 [Planctomycetes bacterium]|nr:hypothetical protein [Planctomycetota bacterium]
MKFEISRVEVWAGEVQDRRGALADTLKSVLDAGADLDFIIARPSPVKPGTGILYLAPLAGETQLKAAEDCGLHPSSHIQALRVIGPDQRGLAERITRSIADADINISGLTAGRMGDRCVLYLRFEQHGAVERAHKTLEETLD